MLKRTRSPSGQFNCSFLLEKFRKFSERKVHEVFEKHSVDCLFGDFVS